MSHLNRIKSLKAHYSVSLELFSFAAPHLLELRMVPLALISFVFLSYQ
jgi:hypothetical protein